MIYEHFALNVSNPIEMAEWYVKNCKMKIVKGMKEPPFAHFLADKTGRVVLEIYLNKNSEIQKFEKDNLLKFHFAFMVKDAEDWKNKLIQAGATFVEEIFTDDGSQIVMLRDPFKMPLQLCRRGKSMMDIEL